MRVQNLIREAADLTRSHTKDVDALRANVRKHPDEMCSILEDWYKTWFFQKKKHKLLENAQPYQHLRPLNNCLVAKIRKNTQPQK